MVFGLLLTVVGLGALCALIYNCAVYALPFAAGLWVFFGVLHLGGGYLGAIVIGLVAGGVALGLGQLILGSARSNVIRIAVVIAFVAPAALVGYSSGLQLSELAISSGVWQHIYAVIGAVSVGGTALVRLGAPMAGSDGAHRG